MFATLQYYALFSGIEFLLLPFLGVALYILWKLLISGANRFLLKEKSSSAAFVILAKFLSTFLLVILGWIFISGSLIHYVVSSAEPNTIAANNETLMMIDERIFGSFVPFWLHSNANPWKPFFDSLSPILIGSYTGLTFAIFIVFILVLATNSNQFQRLVLAFFISVVISAPLWYLYPALSPYDAFVRNQLHQKPSPAIQSELSHYDPNPQLKNFLNQVRASSEATGDFPAITTIPSMHVAWAGIITYFGIMVWPMLAIVLIPYFLLNFVAIAYTLQHYFIDGFAGIVIGILACVIALRAIRPERTQTTITTLIQQDLKSIRSLFGKFLYLTHLSKSQ